MINFSVLYYIRLRFFGCWIGELPCGRQDKSKNTIGVFWQLLQDWEGKCCCLPTACFSTSNTVSSYKIKSRFLCTYLWSDKYILTRDDYNLCCFHLKMSFPTIVYLLLLSRSICHTFTTLFIKINKLSLDLPKIYKSCKHRKTIVTS